VLIAFAVFCGYGILLYAAGWRLLRTPAKGTFYLIAAALDFVFVVSLILLTGVGESPFYRALYLWVALLAFYFGRWAGIVGSALAVAVFLLFYSRSALDESGWLLAVQAGGMLLHGPLIGYLVDRERKRVDALGRARDRLDAAEQEIVEKKAQLHHAEELSSLGLLAAGVAHEVNNPLSGVLACVKALRDQNVPAERQAEYFETVIDGLERIRRTVQGLLHLTRRRNLDPMSVDTREVVGSCLRLVESNIQEKRLRVTLQVAPGAEQIHADRAQLSEAILNLLMNAIHAAPEGGEVAVTALTDAGRVGIHVHDDGPGIPEEVLGRVCDPFFTTKPPGEGTGLGLAITLGITRAHGGDLAIESNRHGGTSVTIWLPERGASAHA
jgi:signal transduction histidine kinase